MLSASLRRVLSLTLLSALVVPALSQQFEWSFTEPSLAEGTDILACTPLIVQTEPEASSGPLFMISYEIGGTPQTQPLVPVNGALTYTVRHAPGAQLIFNVVDENGGSGGVSASVYNVVEGGPTDCIQTPPRGAAFTIHSNHTGFGLQTCEPWGIAIKGGVPPYTVSFASPGAPSVTNVTLDAPENNLYTYINRVPPKAQVLAAVSDSAGSWARGVPLLTTEGAEDTACGGATSSSGVATAEQLAGDVEEPTPISSSSKPAPSSTGSAKPQASGKPQSEPTNDEEGTADNANDDDAGSAVRALGYGMLMMGATLIAGIAMAL